MALVKRECVAPKGEYCMTPIIRTLCNTGNVSFNYIHEGNLLASISTELDDNHGANLGSYPFWCLGELTECYDGFSLTAWIKPRPLPVSSPTVVIVSNGGHLAHSNGFYLRRSWGDQYEAGVSTEDRTWTAAVQLVAGSWLHVAFTWSDRDGLKLYIDGFLKAEDLSGSRRTFVYYMFDATSQVQLGGWTNEDGIIPSLACHVSEVNVSNVIFKWNDIAKFAGDEDKLYAGCQQGLHSNDTKSVLIPRQYDYVTYCRNKCEELGKKLSRTSQRHRLCSCLDTYDPLLLSPIEQSECVTDGRWQVHYACHATTSKNVTLTVTLESVKVGDRISTGQDVILKLTVYPIIYGKILVTVDFGDGFQTTIYPGVTSHSWSLPGIYTVKAVASFGILKSHFETNITVIRPVFRSKPEFVGLYATQGHKSRSIKLKTLLVDKLDTECSLQYGDSTNDRKRMSSYINGFDSHHTYSMVGHYIAGLKCNNSIGEVEANADVFTRKFEINKVIHISGSDLKVNLAGDKDFKKSLKLVLSNQRAFGDFRVSDTGLTIIANNFKKSNTYVASIVTSSGKELTRYIINSQGLLKKPKIMVNKLAGVKGTFVASQFVLYPGEKMNVKIRYGENNTDYTYYFSQDTSITMVRVVRFDRLGYFPVSMEVTNDVSHFRNEKIISIEEPLRKIVVAAVNGSKVGVSIPFTVSINSGSTVPLRVTLQTDFGDGVVETTTHNNHETDRFVITLLHPFALYGDFHVYVKASNKLTYLEYRLAVKVGEGVSNLRLMRSADRIRVDGNVYYTIAYVAGINVTFHVDLGDSQFSIPEIAFDKAMAQFYIQNKDSKMKLIAKRRNNAVVYSTPDEETIINFESKRLTVQHKYVTVGKYPITVAVSNVFNSVTKTLSPRLWVVSKNQQTNCTTPKVTIRKPRYNILRSEPAVFHPAVYMTCDVNATFTVTLSRIFRDLNHLEENFPDVSIEAALAPIIPELSLPYGFFRVDITVSPFGDDMKYTSVSTSLKVTESRIVAKLAGDKKLSVYLFGSTTLDVSPSYHPDNPNRGRTDLEYDIFCASTYYKEDLDDIFHPRRNLTADIVTSGFFYPNTTKNPINFYDAGGCFDKRHVDVTLSAGKLILPSSELSSKTDTFFIRLFVSRGEMFSDDGQSIYVRSSNDSSEYDQLDDLLASGDVGTVLKIVTVLNRGLNSGKSPTNSKAKNDKKEKRTKLINVIGKMAANITDSDTIGNTVNALADITQTKDEVSQESRKAATDAVAHMTKATERMGEGIPLEKAMDVGQGIMATLSNLYPDEEVESIFMKKKKEGMTPPANSRPQTEKGNVPEDNTKEDVLEEKEENEDKVIEGVLKQVVGLDNPSWNTSTYRNLIRFYYPGAIDEFKQLVDDNHPDDLRDFLLEELRMQELQEKIDEKEADKQVATMGTNAISGLANLALSKITDNGTVSINSSKLELKVSKINLNDSGSGVKDMDAGFNLPESAMLNATSGSKLGIQMSKSKVNQFTWEDGSDAITGGTFSLSLTDEAGGLVPVTNTGEDSPISFWLDSNTQGKPKKKIYTVHQSSQRVNLNYHFINHTNVDLSMRATIRPLGDFVLGVYLVYNGFPNDSFYDYKETIPKDDTEFLKYNDTEKDHLMHTIIIPSHITQRAGVYRFAIATYGKVNHSYTFQFFETGCKYRDVIKKKWSGEGCRVGELSSYESTNCLCTHLTSFGGNFIVPPNKIDFNTVWAKFKDLNENAAVFGTVISILILYIILVLWAWRADKRDITKWGAIPLEDNLPSDSYHYQLSVHTGTKKGSGTKSRISFVISGDESDSGVRRLTDGKRKELPVGSILNFVLSVESSLGSMSFLRIWHDNSGKGKYKSWFFEQMEVVDLQTNEKYIFLCDRWLAVEEDDGMIERIIPVAGINDLINFKHLFSTSVRKKLSNEHLWFSVLSRPTRSNFTRVQRLSCCLSLLFLTMITNAMWFKSEENVNHATALRIGPFAFTLEQVFISVMGTLIVFPPSFLLITLFRRCRNKKNNILQSNQTIPKQSQKYKWKSVTNSGLWSGPEKSKADKFKDTMTRILDFHRGKLAERGIDELEKSDSNKNLGKKAGARKGWSLPHSCLYLAWILCFVSVIGPAFFTILYSMEWGAEKANDWLITFLMSFFESVIIVQPIKVLCLVAFLACVLKKPDLGDDDTVDDSHGNDIASDEEVMSKTTADINAIMLQRKRACEELRPPDVQALESARQLRLNELKMEAIIKDIIIYAIFLLILFFLSYQTRDDDSFFAASNLRNIFESSNNGLSFKSIKSIADYWKWLNTILLPSLYATSHFNNTKLKWWDKNCIVDLASRRVGVARLRQMRIKDDSCHIHSSMDTVINHCRSGYSWTVDDTKTYYKGWRSEPLHKNESLVKQKFTPWDYQNSLELKNAPYYGAVTMYKGGGYTYVFKRSLTATQQQLHRLQKKNWIDLRARAVFLEFALYNPNVNLFTSVVMLVEFLPTGSAFTRSDFKVFRLYSYLGAFGIIVIIFQVIYVFFTIYFIVHAFKKLKRDRLKYFKCFWSVLEFILLIFSLIGIIMYAIKHVITDYSLSALKKADSGEFVNFQSVSLYDEFYSYVVGTIVFLSTIQFLKLLQFNRRMNMLGDTIRLSFKDLKLFSVTFLIYFLAFGMFAYLIFGTTLAAYGNFTSTLESLFAFALGDFDFHDMTNTQMVLGPIFFFAYVAIVYIGLMGIFLTIIYEAFAQIKSDTDLQSNDHEIVDFIWKRFKTLLGVK